MKTILLVEDNEDVRELIGLILRDGGYDVCEAENGRDALDQLESMATLPSLMLLDLMMPVMSGMELMQIMATRNDLAALPVVVLSAGGSPVQAPLARKFLRKPADPQVIRALVLEICGTP